MYTSYYRTFWIVRYLFAPVRTDCLRDTVIVVDTARCILITGASAGIGRAAALLFAQRGWQVIACTRSGRDHPVHAAIRGCAMDVAVPSSVKEAFGTFKQEALHIDVVVNNAATLLRLPFLLVSDADNERMFQVNVLGPMRVARGWLSCAAPAADGVLINVGSLAAQMGMLYHSSYCATKHALAGWSEALSYELKLQNVMVKTVDPLDRVGTQFTSAAAKEERGRIEDENNMDHYRQYSLFMSKETSVLSAETVAEVIWKAATDGTNKMRYAVSTGVFMRCVVALHSIAPSLVRRLMMKRYERLRA